MRRNNKNITVSESDADYILANYKTKTYREMAEELNLHPSKVIQNSRVMGLFKEEARKTPDFDKNGIFDIDAFFRLYNF